MAEEQYEIEIKALLGDQTHRDLFLDTLRSVSPNLTAEKEEKQLNHYFVGGEPSRILEKIATHIPAEQQAQLKRVLTEGKNISVRTRQANDRVIFVVKASIDDTTSSNGTARIEFESEVSLTLEELDRLLLEAGCSYQAKWSREREEYLVGDTTVCIDRNAGYGYVAEFERVISDQSEAESVKAQLRSLMTELGVKELPQDRLERMFAYYNEHWPEYYGTDKIFVIE